MTNPYEKTPEAELFDEVIQKWRSMADVEKTTMVIRQYLHALKSIKSLRSLDGTSYTCFGGYNEHNKSCNEYAKSPDNVPCQICMAQVQRPGADWIKDFLVS